MTAPKPRKQSQSGQLVEAESSGDGDAGSWGSRSGAEQNLGAGGGEVSRRRAKNEEGSRKRNQPGRRRGKHNQREKQEENQHGHHEAFHPARFTQRLASCSSDRTLPAVTEGAARSAGGSRNANHHELRPEKRRAGKTNHRGELGPQ
jgi:hypothetical protein